MSTICVIGCGWLGLPIAAELAERGFNVIGTTTSEERIPEIRCRGIHPRIYRIGDPNPPSASIYIINVPPSKTGHYLESMTRTAEALDPKSNVLFISTTSVYTGRPDIFPESLVVPGRPEPEDKHRTSKHSSIPISDLILAEGLFWDVKRKRHSILRCGGLVGPGREAGRFMAGRTNVPDPDGPANTSPLDEVTETVIMMILLGEWGKVVNAVKKDRPTRREYYTKAALDLGLTPPEFAEGG